ncbi:dnaJ homolog subfamily B member 14 isoform X2 [Canis lupus baileyi]|uniref:dnaJ homolog subfamily B member 14 isoform X2 n=1 Tax=Canis lupus dingo TaxID=286419 RepID=UPI0015F127FD|nr:dnaJ homolog subfamily B member 14 isoform X2 [Canis lupus dingo]XP_038300169.1 dnaJ homolog subfamily B member 14 isoform X4 [Canis lupus familiaris]XP_038317976.1 dnaJ homolog subfamily B member 14 isoform X4 [Canis lupus familiaris]XP_038437961.1 dnaJ homolog subfamily B member 14 isoform X4 [Canis lupus familiaris]XP_041615059.1 dnaJ homolog subfamily B member 14 isoform X3 [Vulpes lagopus]
MEGNRDEAEKCVEIAREALNAGNREKAQRFLQKAEKLYPLPSARALLEIIMKNGSTAGNSPHCRKPSGCGGQSKPNCTKDSTSGGNEGGKGYTKDQIDGVLRGFFSEESHVILC